MKDSIHSLLSKLCHFLEKIVIFSCVTSFAFAAILYVLSICLRMFAQSSYPWIDQLTSYLFAVAPILGAGLAIRSDENLKIEVFKNLAKNRYILLITRLFALIVSLFFLHFFYQHFIEEWRRETVAIVFLRQWMLDIPYIFFFVVSVCFYLEIALNTWSSKDLSSKDFSSENV